MFTVSILLPACHVLRVLDTSEILEHCSEFNVNKKMRNIFDIKSRKQA